MGAAAQRIDQGKISFERSSDSTLVVHLSGPWHLQRDLPPLPALTSWPHAAQSEWKSA